MAEEEKKMIKTITIGENKYKIDYESLENLPNLAALEAKIDSITPRYAHFTVAAADKDKVFKVHIHKYACPERFDDEPEGYKVDNGKLDAAVIMARDGDFGYHAIDGTGQINFTVEFADGYKEGYVVIPVITPVDGSTDPKAQGYSNFKSKYSTGLNCPLGSAYDYLGLVTDGVYRITKVTKDINVELHVYKEADLPAHTITYNLHNPDNVEGFEVVNYRVADGIEKVAKYGVYDSEQPVSESNPKNGYPKEFQRVLEFTDGTTTDYTFNDASGFKDNGTYDDGTAGLQFTVVGLPELTTYSATISGAPKKDYSKFEYSQDFGGYYAANKVGTDLTVDITIAGSVNITATAPEGAYPLGDVVPQASKAADYTFEVYYDIEKKNWNSDLRQLLPDPATILAEGTSRIASITAEVDGVPTELVAGTDYYVNAVINPDGYQTFSIGAKPNKVEYYILNDGKFAAVIADESGNHAYGSYSEGAFVKEADKTEAEIAELRVNKYISGLSGKKATITIKQAKITGDIVITTAVPASN